jgi:cytosine/adenosine deaminase-related metal-dependent hydrolase
MLAVGKVADIVVLDAEHPALIGRFGDAALDAWTFATGDGVVRDVLAGGRRVVADGRHVAREAVLARVAAAMRRLPL